MRNLPKLLIGLHIVGGFLLPIGVGIVFLREKNYSAAAQCCWTIAWAYNGFYWMGKFFNLSSSITKFFETERKIADEQAQMSQLFFIPRRAGNYTEKGH